MPELTSIEKIVDSVPRFTLPPELTNKPAEAVTDEPKAVESAPTTEPEKPVTEKAPEQETTGKDPEKPSTRRLERRIDRATRNAAEAQARAEAAERRAQELEARLNQPKAPDLGPKMEDYTDINEFAKAREEYAVKKATAEAQTRAREESYRAAQLELKQNWDTQFDRGSGKYDDYQEIVGELHPTTPWAVGIMLAENGDDVAYHLGKHPAEVEKIAALPPFKQFLEIGRLSAKLSQAPVAPKQPSKAPAPITPVTGSAQATDVDFAAPMSPEQYMRIGHKVFRGR